MKYLFATLSLLTLTGCSFLHIEHHYRTTPVTEAEKLTEQAIEHMKHGDGLMMLQTEQPATPGTTSNVHSGPTKDTYRVDQWGARTPTHDEMGCDPIKKMAVLKSMDTDGLLENRTDQAWIKF